MRGYALQLNDVYTDEFGVNIYSGVTGRLTGSRLVDAARIKQIKISRPCGERRVRVPKAGDIRAQVVSSADKLCGSLLDVIGMPVSEKNSFAGNGYQIFVFGERAPVAVAPHK